MVPYSRKTNHSMNNSPRIRGDGPVGLENKLRLEPFSPYSRGWSLSCSLNTSPNPILPVFAGMVRRRGCGYRRPHNSPRIRGDGPTFGELLRGLGKFSPYSRGWSHPAGGRGRPARILPVFAGMVPASVDQEVALRYSPRIRGDGPSDLAAFSISQKFSPYSRGWS